MDLLNDLLDAVSAGISAVCPGIPIYSEEVPQQVPERCFLIGYAGDLDISPTPHGGRSVSGKLDITYLAPERELEVRRELNRVYCDLALGLRRVEHGGVAVTLGQHRRVDNGSSGTLHDLVSFRAILMPVDGTPLMSNITIDKEGLK